MKIRKHIKPNMKNIFLGLAFLTTALAAHAQSWTNQFDSAPNVGDFARAMAVDSSGNVIITGESGTWPPDCVTIKYSAAGVPLWTNRYSSSLPAGVAVDAAGNVFVALQGLGLIKYSSAGLPLWTNLDYFWQGLEGMALDGAGNVCVIGGVRDADPNFLTAKYSNNGLPLWTNRYNAPDGSGGAKAIAVDTNGNVIVVGDSPNGTNYDFLTIKYSASGVGLWTNIYSVTGSSAIGGLAVDGQGNVFVTGFNSVNDDPNTFDVLTIKYSSTGTPLWTKRFNGPGNGADFSSSVAVDTDGNVFVAGSSALSGLTYRLTLKYSGAGIPLWTNYYIDAADGGENIATGLAVDKVGNVFVTGSHFATVAYSNSGLPLWTNRYNAFYGSGQAIAVDHGGNVIVTGGISNDCQQSSSSFDYLTIKYAVGVSPPLLDIQRLGNNLVLSWTNAAFGLQSAPAISGTFTNVPGATSPYTNSISGGQRFFRLVQ